MSLTVAVTHWNRYDMLLASIALVLDDPRVDEIVISDDHSTDGSWERMQFLGGGHVRLYRNEQNMDCYWNKMLAVQRARNPWVILFDSDNVLPQSYLDALDEVRPWDEGTAYLPVFAEPEFDYREFAGLRVTRATVAEHADRPMFLTALNTANYFVPRAGYLDVWTPGNPRTVDSMWMNYRWLESGRALQFVPGMTYTHRMHPGSHFVQNHTKADELASRALQQKIRELR